MINELNEKELKFLEMLVENESSMLDLLKKFKQNGFILRKEVSDFKANKNNKQKTIRISETLFNNLGVFAGDRSIPKVDVMNMAMLEFLEKYNNNIKKENSIKRSTVADPISEMYGSNKYFEEELEDTVEFLRKLLSLDKSNLRVHLFQKVDRLVKSNENKLFENMEFNWLVKHLRIIHLLLKIDFKPKRSMDGLYNQITEIMRDPDTYTKLTKIVKGYSKSNEVEVQK